MYSIIFITIFSLLLLFIIYNFYSKIDSIVKRYLPTQRVLDIKSEMHNLDESTTTAEKNPPVFQNISQKISDLLYLPIDFLRKIILSILPNKLG